MNILVLLIDIILAIICGLGLLLSLPLFFSFRWPSAGMWILKVTMSAFSPILALLGAITATAGWITHSLLLTLLGLAVFLMNAVHFYLITQSPSFDTGFEQSFGADWRNKISPALKAQFLAGRNILRLPVTTTPHLKQNIAFAMVPESGRTLLCDLWLPAENVKPSGLAFIYLHGGAFYILDKDCGTRPFFSHLASQGHVIMDLAYRLAPETDILGMVQDTKRAIIWMKNNAREWGVNPDRIIVGGGSAGGHLALLAAYTWDDPDFTPPELKGKDLSVSAVISLYGTCDLQALYYHTNQHLSTRGDRGATKMKVPTKMPLWMKKIFGKDYHRLGFDKPFENTGALAPLLGGHPDECPDRYAMFSPISHVHAGCPPSLLIHGTHDIMAPITATRQLHQYLLEKKVPVVFHTLPQTDHAFDLICPKIAPAAHNAIYDVERFLAIMSSYEVIKKAADNKQAYIIC